MKELADRITDHYERYARDWDADRNRSGQRWLDQPWLERFVAALPAKASILDLGCGSGAPVAEYLAGRGLRVTGVDSSPTLVSLCHQRLPGHQWLVQDMRRLNLSRQFDAILAWDSLFHLAPDDQRRMFDIFGRHAAQPAVLMFNSGPARGESIGIYRGDPLYHASLDPHDYTDLIAGIGFEVIAHAVEDWENGGGRTVWLARSRAARS